MLALACLAGITVLTAAAASASSAAAGARRDAVAPSSQRAIARAFSNLTPVRSVSAGRAHLQGYDIPMRLALLGTEDHEEASREAPSTLTVHVGSVLRTFDGGSVATVPLNLEFSPSKRQAGLTAASSYTIRFDAVALHERGQWEVSWTTMCLLVEQAGTGCPAPPKGLSPGNVLPSLVDDPGMGPSLTPGIVDPGALAMGFGGSLFIADDARNQILRWQSGVLSVVAGNATAGFSGDGGPATAAEIDDPGEMAVGPNGSLYFVDAGNNRVREISINGLITTVAGDGVVGNTGDGGPATRAEIDPSGLAVGPTGYMWIASDSGIRVLDPQGVISTLVAGGPPAGVDVTVDGTPTAFFPESLALSGQGSLVAFSSSPKLLLEISPDGSVTQVAQDYVTALSTTPDGVVLVAEHGTGIEKVSGSSESMLYNFSDIKVPGLAFSLAPHGVAESSDGTIYTDTEPGDGFTDQAGLYSVSPAGLVRPLRVTNTVSSTLPAPGAIDFPTATYPIPSRRARPDTTMTECPSAQGVVPFTPATMAAARRLAAKWGTSFSSDLQHSDRSWWPSLVAGYPQFGQQGPGSVTSATAATDDLSSSAVAAACGRSLVEKSLAVALMPSAYSSVVATLYLIDRGGTPLVYFEDN
jgi:hypothetical protein